MKRTNKKKSGTLFYAAGSVQDFPPANGKEYTLEELQKAVGGNIEIVSISANRLLVCNENGLALGLAPNHMVSSLFLKDVPQNHGTPLLGDVVVCDRSLVR